MIFTIIMAFQEFFFIHLGYSFDFTVVDLTSIPLPWVVTILWGNLRSGTSKYVLPLQGSASQAQVLSTWLPARIFTQVCTNFLVIKLLITEPQNILLLSLLYFEQAMKTALYWSCFMLYIIKTSFFLFYNWPWLEIIFLTVKFQNQT